MQPQRQPAANMQVYRAKLAFGLLVGLVALVTISSSFVSAASAFDEEADSSSLQPNKMFSAPSSTFSQQQNEPRGLDSNIANAKVQVSQKDLSTAAGHHYHGKHSVHGWLKMGAHSGKKGAFGWHAKYPVGGKGRR